MFERGILPVTGEGGRVTPSATLPAPTPLPFYPLPAVRQTDWCGKFWFGGDSGRLAVWWFVDVGDISTCPLLTPTYTCLPHPLYYTLTTPLFLARALFYASFLRRLSSPPYPRRGLPASLPTLTYPCCTLPASILPPLWVLDVGQDWFCVPFWKHLRFWFRQCWWWRAVH